MNSDIDTINELLKDFVPIISKPIKKIADDEIFTDIPDYDGDYQISNYGTIVSFKSGIGKILNQSTTTSDYEYVNLCKNGKEKTRPIHVLVAITYLNHRPDGHKLVVDHIDGDKTNNKVSNLQIITHRENIKKRKDKNKYSGVYPHKQKWQVKIYVNTKRIHFGLYAEEEEAAKVAQNVYDSIEINKYVDCSKIIAIERNDIIYDRHYT